MKKALTAEFCRNILCLELVKHTISCVFEYLTTILSHKAICVGEMMRKYILSALTFIFLFSMAGQFAFAEESAGYAPLPPAKNLTNRISIGYNKQLNFGIIGGPNASIANTFFNADCLSTKYWATDRIGMEFMVGYFTAKYEEVGGWVLDLGGKFLYNLIIEDNMAFYTGAGLGIMPTHIDYGATEENEVGFQMGAFVGWEFFFSELPNLGFDVEIGLRYIDIDEYAQLSTFGGAFSMFGIRYYF